MGDPSHDLARHVAARAHGLRNDVATLRSAVQLVDDADVAHAIASATSSLQVELERAVVLARVALDQGPGRAAIDVAKLVELAARRARREGADVPEQQPLAAGTQAWVPGQLIERLLADLLHHADGPVVLIAGLEHARLQVSLRVEPDPVLTAVLEQIASAGGCDLLVADEVATVVLPNATSISVG